MGMISVMPVFCAVKHTGERSIWEEESFLRL